MDALELTMKCSKLLQMPYLTSSNNDVLSAALPSNSSIISNDDNKLINTSFSDNDIDANRNMTKEGELIMNENKIDTVFYR